MATTPHLSQSDDERVPSLDAKGRKLSRDAADLLAVLRAIKIAGGATDMLADFVMLDKDYLTIPEDEIRFIKPLLTVVGGRVVYQSKTQ